MTEPEAWESYRRMFLDDRNQNRENFERVFEKLDGISSQLTVMKTERKIGGWVVGIVVPAAVALATAAVARAWGL